MNMNKNGKLVVNAVYEILLQLHTENNKFES